MKTFFINDSMFYHDIFCWTNAELIAHLLTFISNQLFTCLEFSLIFI